MDSLLCDEVCLTPTTDHHHHHGYAHFCGFTKQECEEGFSILLDKEKSYMPPPGYVHFLACSHNLALARFQAVQCLLKCGCRLRLSPETVFNAVNYLDRFLSLNQCSYSTVQLVSVACLSIAAKFIDTCSPSVHEIQAQGMSTEISESSESIEHIELRVLQVLGWRLSSTTAYSYAEMLFSGQWHDHHFHYHNDFISTLTNLLFTALLDQRLVGHRPCVVAASALKLLGAGQQFGLITNLIPHDFKGDLIKCDEIMEGLLIEQTYNTGRGRGQQNHHTSPVTVLLPETRVDMISDDDDCVDDDGIGIIPLSNRKREPPLIIN